MRTRRSGGHILAHQLLRHGVERAFGVPGESYLDLLDGLYEVKPELQFVTCRNEGGAAIMAEAHGKLTGKPGICIVTRGPGATNASHGIHIAQQDSTPMIMLIGQVGRGMIEREAFQEINYSRFFGPICKWAAQIDSAERIPEFLSRAFAIATSGRPGPVVLALPEDMLKDEVDVGDALPFNTARAAMSPEALRDFELLLNKSERPLAIVGGGGWSEKATQELEQFASRTGIPVATSFRRQHLFNNTHPQYIGEMGLGMNPRLAQRVKDADLIALIGGRLGEVQTNGYSLLDIPNPVQTLIHIHPAPEELGRVYRAELAVNADMQTAASQLEKIQLNNKEKWLAWTQAARQDYERWSTPTQTPGALKMGGVIKYLRESLPADTIISNGAGNYTVWVHRFYHYRKFATQLAPISGSMGYGVPAAVAAKLAYPDRTVIAFAGDGCFMMNGQEFATAVQYGANIICIVVNNGMLGTIRMHQERHYPTRVSNTQLVNPDFVAYAEAFGGYGELVTTTEDFPAALNRAQASGKPAILELQIDPEALTPAQTLAEITHSALKK